MLASVEWLRTLCPTELEAPRIAALLTSRGLTVDGVSGPPTAAVLDVDVPANRPDCLGHLGLARELSAALGRPLARWDEPLELPAAGGPDAVAVEIEDPGDCARYSARIVRGVRVGPSPDWVVRRLESCGLRSTNNVVDASNLVLLELGNPVHFFDLAHVAGPRIRVRRAAAGERLVTLDGVERALDEQALVIADARGPVALAGAIGGASSEIREATRDVLVEAAWFAPRAVRRTCSRLELRTEASYRFERGVDPDAVPAAQVLAARLLQELAGGAPAAGAVDVDRRPNGARDLVLRLAELPRLLGYRPEAESVLEALARLRLRPRRIAGDSVAVAVPSWRFDLEREADLVEEVARHLGYDAIPAELGRAVPAPATDPRPRDLEERARDALCALGFHESLGYSMLREGEDDPFVAPSAPAAVALANPIADWLSHLRRSMIPGLLRAVDLNHRHGSRDVRLFEVGRVFLSTGDGSFPAEPVRLGFAWSGAGDAPHWSRPTRDVDVYDTVGLTEHVLQVLSPGSTPRRAPGTPPGVHPALGAAWLAPDGERALAWAGRLHPDLAAGRPHPVFLAEIDLTALGEIDPGAPRYRPVPRLNAVTRDLALVLPADASFERVIGVLGGVAPPAPVTFSVVDRYEGPPLAPGASSVTVRARLEPHERTLQEVEIEAYRRALVARLESDAGIRIRDGGSPPGGAPPPNRDKIDTP